MTYAQRILRFSLSAAVTAMVFAPSVAFADVTGEIQKGLSGAAGAAGYGQTAPDLGTVAGRLIGQLLGLVGVILLAYILYGGFMWMTAAGEEKKVTTAKHVIRDAIIGLVVIVTAYALTNFVLTTFVGQALNPTTAGVTPKTP